MIYDVPYTSICNKLYKNKIATVKKDLITFFTPTYNRAKFLPRVERCLINQTCQDFVWIIVKDGSSDNTDEIVQRMLEREILPILYISKPNGGKHSAFKLALDKCETGYFQCVDDDDLYSSQATDFYLKKWKEIKDSPQSEFIGAIRTLCKKPDGSYSANFCIDEGKEEDMTTLEAVYLLNRHQENWTCYDTNKLKSIEMFTLNYWMADKHKFFLESIWQGRFARKFKCRYIYQAFEEYRSDDEVSLMRQIKSEQYYIDRFINSKIILDEQYDYISLNIWSLLKHCLDVCWLRSFLRIKITELIKHTHNRKLKILYSILFPLSFLNKWYINKYC